MFCLQYSDHPLQPTPGGPHRAPPSLPPRSKVWAELRGVWAELVHQQLAGLLFLLPINQWVDPVGQGRASAVGILLGRGKWFPAARFSNPTFSYCLEQLLGAIASSDCLGGNWEETASNNLTKRIMLHLIWRNKLTRNRTEKLLRKRIMSLMVLSEA